MKLRSEQLRLYVITDRSWLKGRSFVKQIEQIAQSGATMIQLREKGLELSEWIQRAKEIRQITRRYQIPQIINDNVQVCLESDSDGVHLGQGDQSIWQARQQLGPNKIIGATAKTIQQALQAQQEGADYLGVGAVFGSSTKSDAIPISIQTFQQVKEAVSIPVVAIGGIGPKNVMQLKYTKTDGIAVISAIFAAENIGKATKQMRAYAEEVCR